MLAVMLVLSQGTFSILILLEFSVSNVYRTACQLAVLGTVLIKASHSRQKQCLFFTLQHYSIILIESLFELSLKFFVLWPK